MSVTDIGANFSGLIASLTLRALSPHSRLNWIYLLSALVMALYACRTYRGLGEKRTLRQILFPRSVWLHSSALTDYRFVAVTLPVWTLWAAPNLLSANRVSQHTLAALTNWLGPIAQSAMPTAAVGLLYTVAQVAASDFARYWSHRMMHRVPVLWEFHKVHHSAEVLTPISLYRSHPLDTLLTELAEVVVVGIVSAIFLYLFPQGLTLVTILGVNAFRFAFNFFGANLRHSHIWFSFGSAAEHFIISPAQHQIHHSADPRHFNRNFGSEFAVWDWIFGTLYIPRQREDLILGLGAAENRRLGSTWEMLINPIRAMRRHAYL